MSLFLPRGNAETRSLRAKELRNQPRERESQRPDMKKIIKLIEATGKLPPHVTGMLAQTVPWVAATDGVFGLG